MTIQSAVLNAQTALAKVAAEATAARTALDGVVQVIGDNQFYGQGVWSAYIAPWGKGNLVEGTDYTESAVLFPATFPNGTIMAWDWPAVKPPDGVYGFNQISYGDSNGGSHTTPSVQIKNLNTLTSSHNIFITGAPNNYDVMYDGFLTSSPYETNIDEISIFLHTSAPVAAYVASIKQLGKFVGSGITWTVAQSAPGGQICFMPANEADLLSLTVDIKAMLAWLVTKGILTGNEYFNGIALGVEPYENDGTLTYNSWSVTQN